MPKLPPSNPKAEGVLLFCDGASRGNPGPAAYGFVILQGDEVLAEQGGCLGITTNNVAEYEGLVRGLTKANEIGVKELTVKSDSELMVRQLNGIYKVKAPQLFPLFQKASKLLKEFSKVAVTHVPRAENSLADALANQALDHQKNS